MRFLILVLIMFAIASAAVAGQPGIIGQAAPMQIVPMQTVPMQYAQPAYQNA